MIYNSYRFLLILTLSLFMTCSWGGEKIEKAESEQLQQEQPLNITVYRSPRCGCCTGWVRHLQSHQFNVTDIKTNNVGEIKQKYGIPQELASCHTAVIEGYAIEGHVPAADIKQLLSQKPDVVGLTVPHMPVGTPGMEMGDRKDSFSVLTFDKEGKTKVFNQYTDY